jgi:hypothetical protein
MQKKKPNNFSLDLTNFMRRRGRRRRRTSSRIIFYTKKLSAVDGDGGDDE